MILQGLIFGGGGGGSPFPLADASSMGWADALFFRTGANSIAQRNGTNAQTFRVYGTYTDASNGDWLNFTKAAGGAATISTAGNGTGTAHDLIVQSGAGATLNLNRFGSAYLGSGSVYFGAALTSAAGATAPGLVFGTNKLTASSFAGGQIPVAMQYLEIDDGITAPGALATKARIYVDTADGDLKVVFADGTVKTIVTDT